MLNKLIVKFEDEILMSFEPTDTIQSVLDFFNNADLSEDELEEVEIKAVEEVESEDDDEEAEKKVVLANDNFTEVAAIILEGVGGKENVASIDNCITRLRLEVKDNTLVNEKKIKSAGVSGVIRPGKTSVQVVVGTKVQFVADEFKKLCK